jgi:hypothetical protein
MRIGAREAAKIRPVADPDAGDEKPHGLLWLLGVHLRGAAPKCDGQGCS